MTPEQRRAARARCEAAHKGPWKPSYGLDDVRVTIVRCGPYPYDDAIAKVYGNVNAEFIYHARTDLPAALDALDAKDAENERLKDLLRDWCSVPWQHKTPEMLERTRAALERPA